MIYFVLTATDYYTGRRLMSKYRSGMEERVGAVLEPVGFCYEPQSIPYIVKKKYTPDFVYGKFMIEVKGWFRPGDTQKYKAIHDSMDFHELVFVLHNPRKKVRKGAQLTMAEWCEKYGIFWCTESTLDLLVEYVGGEI